MDIKKYSSNSLSFIGDAVYTLHVREFFIESNYQQSNKLQYLCNKYNSAKGQMKAFDYLTEIKFFNEEELGIYKRGRNNIRHIPKNGDKHSYEVASGLEAIVGYLYLTDKKRLEKLFKEIFDGVKEYE
ncbi:MAG: ribonuclease III domain-containing protein [Erysipelotrichaceae bacterium]|nr:ribonuclease III domain-containing protein [Erysipelotrichaceae bacterium]